MFLLFAADLLVPQFRAFDMTARIKYTLDPTYTSRFLQTTPSVWYICSTFGTTAKLGVPLTVLCWYSNATVHP